MNHLKEYCGGQLFDTGKREWPDGTGPICILKADGCPDLTIHFSHYKTFEYAKEKWEARVKRMDYSRIFLATDSSRERGQEFMEEYANLPYPKLIYSFLEEDESKHIIRVPMHKPDKDGKVLVTSYISLFGERAYDCYDFFEAIFGNEEQFAKK